MAKDQGIVQTRMRPRPPATGRSAVTAPPPPAVKKPPFDPVRFLTEVRAEGRKVTWTSWKETWITSVMVAIMVVLTAFFFFAVDWMLGLGISGILKLASGG